MLHIQAGQKQSIDRAIEKHGLGPVLQLARLATENAALVGIVPSITYTQAEQILFMIATLDSPKAVRLEALVGVV